jgi:hypothetical protein
MAAPGQNGQDEGVKGSIYNYCVTAHKPTAVTHALVGNFLSSSDVTLILGCVLHGVAF